MAFPQPAQAYFFTVNPNLGVRTTLRDSGSEPFTLKVRASWMEVRFQ